MIHRLTIFAMALFAMALPSGLQAQDRLYANEFPVGDVRLLDSPFSHARDLNIDVLMQYDVDRLLAPYLKEAGLEPRAASFPNWDGLDGHVGGHYLTALAINYAATGDKAVKDRLGYMISELDRAQKASGDGYLGGVPGSRALWTEVRKGNVARVWDSWVPWYNVHKIYAGLRDAWVYAGNEDARRMFLTLCDWGIDVIDPLSPELMEQMLDCEFGGMDEVYADAYAMTGEEKYLAAARKFSHRRLLDSMMNDVDNLDNMHANTQVPKVVGYQRIAELSGDAGYAEAARFFWETVTGRRSLSFGGNSRREHFPSAADCVSYTEEREGPETCNTNNMLKLTEGLFRMNPDARYADYYERAMFNHILSSQHPGHGGFVYFTPARPAHYRVYSQPNSAMWCCVGTGMENHGKYGQFIYTHDGPDSLRVNLYVPSELSWRSRGVTIRQETRFPLDGSSRITVGTDGKSQRFTLLVRHPGWADGMEVRVNGKRVRHDSTPSSYIAIDRKWRNGDVVELDMPMKITLEEMPNVPDYVSVLRGPVVMAQRMGTDRLDGLVGDDSRWGHIAHGPLGSVYDTPIMLGSRDEVLARLQDMKPVEGEPGKYTVSGLFSTGDAVLEPFAGVHDCRYMVYWLNLTPDEYQARLATMREAEKARLTLDARTVDAVNTGEQQPEADHFMTSERSGRGNHNDRAWRDATDGGYFAYRMKTAGADNLELMITYWGNEQGDRTFDILVDGTVIATESIGGKWNKDGFVDVIYNVPRQLTGGKETVTVTFRARPGNTAGGVFMVRLLCPDTL